MPKIVISYRRSDSDAVAGRIRDRLAARYGNESLFMDIDDIPFGTDFRDHIRREMLSSDAVIVVIGPKWLGPAKGGRVRIKEESDPVRIELETALQERLQLIPVLINGARMPAPSDLPDTCGDFAFRNAATVESGRDFHPHMDRLIRTIDRIIGRQAQARPVSAGITEPAQALASAGAEQASPMVSASRFSLWHGLMLAAAVAVVAAVAFSVGAGLFSPQEKKEATKKEATKETAQLPPRPAPEVSAKPTEPTAKPKPAASGCSSNTTVPVLDDSNIPDSGPALHNALTGAITAFFRCSTVPFDNLARAFATISVVVPHHVGDTKCFAGDTRIVVASWADQKAWADRQGREDLLWVSLNRTIDQALACLKLDDQKLFYADFARAFSAATTQRPAHDFVNPSLKGRRIDRCLYYARDCNGPAAEAWCQRYGFGRAAKWEWEYVFPTYTLGDRLVCPAKGCGAFSAITCTR